MFELRILRINVCINVNECDEDEEEQRYRKYFI